MLQTAFAVSPLVKVNVRHCGIPRFVRTSRLSADMPYSVLYFGSIPECVFLPDINVVRRADLDWSIGPK